MIPANDGKDWHYFAEGDGDLLGSDSGLASGRQSSDWRPEMVAGARKHPNCLVLPFRVELIRLAALPAMQGHRAGDCFLLAPAHGSVFEDDEPRVQYFGIDKFEAHLWIASIDGLPTSTTKDERKDHKPEAVDEP
jgi:hypothetical protein